ncbi:MAG: hypothetical protein QOC92_3906 [Acidimicrobiaceae bacterium]
MLCFLALLIAGDAFALGHGKYGVPSGELNAMVRPLAAPELGSDASREEAPPSTVKVSLAAAPGSAPVVTTTPSGPADPPPADAPPALPLRPARLDVDFPDPSVVWGGDRWYAFATGAQGRNVQVSESNDLLNWSKPVEAAPTLPKWAGPGYTWAPTAAHIGNQWVLYVSMAGWMTQCVDRMVSASPGGPYVPVDGGPLVCDQTGGTGAIDPSVMVANGVPHLYWKAAGGVSRQLFGVALTPDGMAFAGTPQHLLAATAGWQNSGVENPSMVEAAGAYWLLYSGAYWATSKYAMGFARCDGPLGPCREMSGSPWVSTRGEVIGPGGGAFFRGPDGVLRLAYHAWSGGTGYGAGGRRALHLEVIDVDAAGPSIISRPPRGALTSVINGPDGVTIRGTATDPDTPASVDVTVFVDGRSVASLAGPNFSVALSPADGQHRVCAVALDDLAQSRPQLGCNDFTVSSVPFGALDGAGSIVTGWAITPSTAATISVDLYVDGKYVSTASADLPRSDVAAAWPAYGAAHGFAAALPALGAGQHILCAYAVTDDNHPAPELGCVPL